MNNRYQILGNFQNVFLVQKICYFGGQQGQLFYLFSSLTESGKFPYRHELLNLFILMG